MPLVRRNLEHVKSVGMVFDDKSRTHQSFKDETNMNNILAKYKTSGQLPAVNQSQPTFADVSSLPSYQKAMNVVSKAHSQFSSLSATVRRRFDNDPAQFLSFMENPANQQEAIDLGLATAKPKVDLPAQPIPQKEAAKAALPAVGEGPKL